MPDDPTTTDVLTAFLVEAGIAPVTIQAVMQRLTDEYRTQAQMRQVDAWLDTLAAAPLTDTEIDAILVTLSRTPRP